MNTGKGAKGPVSIYKKQDYSSVGDYANEIRQTTSKAQLKTQYFGIIGSAKGTEIGNLFYSKDDRACEVNNGKETPGIPPSKSIWNKGHKKECSFIPNNAYKNADIVKRNPAIASIVLRTARTNLCDSFAEVGYLKESRGRNISFYAKVCSLKSAKVEHFMTR